MNLIKNQQHPEICLFININELAFTISESPMNIRGFSHEPH